MRRICCENLILRSLELSITNNLFLIGGNSYLPWNHCVKSLELALTNIYPIFMGKPLNLCLAKNLAYTVTLLFHVTLRSFVI